MPCSCTGKIIEGAWILNPSTYMIRLGSVKLHLVESPQLETFCWDFVMLSKASPYTDTSACKRQRIPVYCFTMACIYVYACWDLHILLFYWLWRLHLTKIPVVNLCSQRNQILFALNRLQMLGLTVCPALSCGPVAWRSFLPRDLLQDVGGALAGWRRLPRARFWARLWEGKLQSEKRWTKMLKQEYHL